MVGISNLNPVYLGRLDEARPARIGSGELQEFLGGIVFRAQDQQHSSRKLPPTRSHALLKRARGNCAAGLAGPTRQQRAVDSDVRVDKGDLAKATAEERRKAAVAKNLGVAGKQPPSTKDVGIDSDRMGGGLNARDVIKMPQEAFAKLTEEQLAKMRGDELS